MPATPRDYRLSTSGTIKIRKAPSLSGEILREVPNNAVVTVWRDNWIPDEPEKQNVTWYPVAYEGVSGWMCLIHDRFSNQFREIVPEVPPPVPTVRINVPFDTQIGNVWANDCGPATVAMVLGWRNIRKPDGTKYTTHDISEYLQHRNNPTGIGDLDKALEYYGVRATPHYRPGAEPILDADLIKSELNAGRPVIALVKRLHLKMPFDPFLGNHFIVITGWADGWFFVHDPLGRNADEGAYVPVHQDNLRAAIQATPPNTIFYAGLTVEGASQIEPLYLVMAVIEASQRNEISSRLDGLVSQLVFVNVINPIIEG